MDSVRDVLVTEKVNMLGENATIIRSLFLCLTKHPAWMRWKYIKYLRLSDNAKGIGKLYYLRKKNTLANILGIEINSGLNIGKGLTLYHNGPIVINSKAQIGQNCVLHGDNCIGNNGIDDKAPVLGNNVQLGVGAKIIGNVKIADGVIIGAGAIVVSDFNCPYSVIGGIPARLLH